MEERLKELFVCCAQQDGRIRRRGGDSGNEDGAPVLVAIDNILHYVHQQGLVKQADLPHFRSVLQQADHDEDGAISLDEFQHAIYTALSAASGSMSASVASNDNSTDAVPQHGDNATASTVETDVPNNHNAQTTATKAASNDTATPSALQASVTRGPPATRVAASSQSTGTPTAAVTTTTSTLASLNDSRTRPSSREAFGSPATRRQPSPERLSAKVIFDLLDPEGRGYVSVEELQTRWEELSEDIPLPPIPESLVEDGQHEDVTAEDLLEAFQSMHADSDGDEEADDISDSRGDVSEMMTDAGAAMATAAMTMTLVNGVSAPSPLSRRQDGPPVTSTPAHHLTRPHLPPHMAQAQQQEHNQHHQHPHHLHGTASPVGRVSALFSGDVSLHRSLPSTPHSAMASPATVRRKTPSRQRAAVLVDTGVRLLRSQVEVLKQQLVDKDEEVRHLQREVDAAKEALHHASDLADVHIGETENQLNATVSLMEAKHQRQIEDLKARHADATSALRLQVDRLNEQNAKLAGEREEHVRQIKELHVDRAKLLTDNQLLRESMHEQHKASAAAASDLNKQTQLVSQLVELQDAHALKAQRINELELEAAQQQDEIASLKSVLGEVRGQLAKSVLAQHEQRWETTETLAAELSRMDNEAEEQLRNKAEEMQQAAQASEKRVSVLLKELASVRETKTALEERAGRMLAQLRNLVGQQRSYIDELETEVASKKLRMEVLALELSLSKIGGGSGSSGNGINSNQRSGDGEQGDTSGRSVGIEASAPAHGGDSDVVGDGGRGVPDADAGAYEDLEKLLQMASEVEGGIAGEGRTGDDGDGDDEVVAAMYEALASPQAAAVRVDAKHLEKWLRRRRESRRRDRRRSSRKSARTSAAELVPAGKVGRDDSAGVSSSHTPRRRATWAREGGGSQHRLGSRDPAVTTVADNVQSSRTARASATAATSSAFAFAGRKMSAPSAVGRPFAGLHEWLQVNTDTHTRRRSSIQALKQALQGAS
ncbi:hypothetical protein PTSG_04893 [Salpingoeca rosetta]|uniref:EF-hand domain-containing protein n=1 Tax=Salpingoeca rosetta (strain ATCC 50818 / BSB-021) TaxID=946362 RepID=F2U8X7_SALR5|nr:uncharacterized protein PTSG_04893 [Salpingoeca rosetta]EGD73180.1 hypothetical protein PTSG_04893 [Salpingoeca rosetta]|eukprot:XP_004994211.1 hypothetical protein PTSG_04893 [Salpingoeca rosetta]